MTDQELRLAKLARILNSTNRLKTRNGAQSDAYNRVVSDLEHSLQKEKVLNRQQEAKLKLQEKAEREQVLIRDSMNRHHFIVLKKQIEEKRRAKEYELQMQIDQELLPDFEQRQSNKQG